MGIYAEDQELERLLWACGFRGAQGLCKSLCLESGYVRGKETEAPSQEAQRSSQSVPGGRGLGKMLP